MKLLIIFILTLMSTYAFSKSWDCSNKDLEITCNTGKCEAQTTSDGFTPSTISINANGNLSLCFYSGCWEGKGKTMKSVNHFIVSGTKLQWTGNKLNTANFIVAVDTKGNVGFIKGESFAMPIICTMQKN